MIKYIHCKIDKRYYNMTFDYDKFLCRDDLRSASII